MECAQFEELAASDRHSFGGNLRGGCTRVAGIAGVRQGLTMAGLCAINASLCVVFFELAWF
ncbi:hypothetical protein [Stenotrophomonas maltophilia]|uniref:hypothetical protein n=1 Tax=Stenotrophomonas maltophilia TaxID=40324 RepID=UPI0012FE7B42|nr:hypothetical protein [Stenotrophomonas maltophilia]